MSKEEVIKLYGRNIYQIRLEIALACYCCGTDMGRAWKKADEFIGHILSDEHKALWTE
jgi:hypothetical protein